MKQKADTVLPGYTAVPIPVLDSTLANTDILARITLTFAQPLSLARIEESWYGLVRSWPILAARVRVTPSSPAGLSFFVPTPDKLQELERRSRDNASKALQRHFVAVDAVGRSIASYHPIVGKAVHAELDAQQISIGTAPEKHEQHAMISSNACTSWKQLLKTDQAYVTAQATKWSDATSVTISFSHTLGDAFAIKDIFTAWERTLKGDKVEGLQDVGKDPFIRYLDPQSGAAAPEQLPSGWHRFGLWKKMQLIRHLVWDISVARPEKTIGQYYIYLPQSQIDQLVAQARSDLDQLRSAAESSSSNSQDEKHEARDYNVSTFNVLFAWLLQNIHAAAAKPSKTSSVLCIVNAKTRPPAGHVQGDYPQHQLWGGAFGAPLRPMSAGEYASLPLGQVALHIRESLKRQIEPENVKRSVTMLLKHSLWKRPTGELLWFSQKPGDYWCGCTEWRSVKFGGVDFGAAVEANDGSAAHETVKPAAISAWMELPTTPRNRWGLLGDAGGGVWFLGAAAKKEMAHKKGFGRYKWVQ